MEGKMNKPETLFISIASYRDAELLPTLQDMLHRAAHPENLRIAICWQDNEDLQVFAQAGLELQGCQTVAGEKVATYRYQQAEIAIIIKHYYSSQGACWARSLAEKLFNNETYFLQIDSHCRFIPRWDSEMIAMLQQLRTTSALPIISSYPPAYSPGEGEEESKKSYVSRLVFNEYDRLGIPMFNSRTFEDSAPVRGSYLAAGFIFTSGDFVSTVANDPQIFFAGEEIAMAVRAFTHGYDIYHPHKPLLWHYYQREEGPKVWGDHTTEAQEEGAVEQAWWQRDNLAKKRVRTLLGLEDESADSLTPYTLGNKRTLRQFEYQAGICLQSGTVLPEVAGSDAVSFFATPPNDEAEWLARQFAWYKKPITLNQADFTFCVQHEGDLHIHVYSLHNVLLYQRKLTPVDLQALRAAAINDQLRLSLDFKAAHQAHQPATIRICPWSAAQGWGTVTESAW